MSSFATGRRALFARLCWVARLETAPTGFGPPQACMLKLETAPTGFGPTVTTLNSQLILELMPSSPFSDMR